MDWIVENKQDKELSVIHKDNKFGKQSYGWEDINKIILFGKGLTTRHQFNIEFQREITQLVCDYMNESNIKIEDLKRK